MLSASNLTVVLQVGIMVAIRHPNVVLFMGLCLDPPCMVTEFCARGSLYDVLNKARAVPQLGAQLDWTRRLNIALDAAKVCAKVTCTVQKLLCRRTAQLHEMNNLLHSQPQLLGPSWMNPWMTGLDSARAEEAIHSAVHCATSWCQPIITLPLAG